MVTLLGVIHHIHCWSVANLAENTWEVMGTAATNNKNNKDIDSQSWKRYNLLLGIKIYHVLQLPLA